MKATVWFAALFAATPAYTLDSSYIAAWTPEPGKCDFSGAGPFRITANGLEEHELSRRTKSAPRWRRMVRPADLRRRGRNIRAESPLAAFAERASERKKQRGDRRIRQTLQVAYCALRAEP
jgi:hypothetical protein